MIAESKQEFGSGDGLADVALGVVRDVDEKAADCGWQVLAAYGAGKFEADGFECANAHGGIFQAGLEFFQDGFRRAVRILF